MKLVSKLSYIDICEQFNHRKIHFISDCEFFPNFDVKVYVYNIYLSNNEIILDTKNISNHKKLTIGCNMKNLQYEFI